MRILLIRHAEPDYAHDCLTEPGRREAALLAERLKDIHPAAVYVSPLGRAQETANAYLRLTGEKAETLPWLAEFRGRAVDAQGKSHIPWDFPARLWAAHPLLLDPERWLEDELVAGGDVADIWAETVVGMDALLARHGLTNEGTTYRSVGNKEDTIMIFCHFGIGMAIMAHLLHMTPVPLWQGFACLPSAVTTLVTAERGPGEAEFRCLSLGDVNHLIQGGEPLSLAGLFPEVWNGVDSTDPAKWPVQPALPPLR